MVKEFHDDPGCLFCGIVAGRIPAFKVAENESALAFLDINPAVPGHTVVIPKSHSKDLHQISSDDLGATAELAKQVAAELVDKLGAEGINLLNNCGAEAWQSVFHFHLHVIPRKSGDPLRLPWIPAQAGQNELEQIQAQLCKSLFVLCNLRFGALSS